MKKKEIGSKVKTFVENHKTELIITGVGIVVLTGGAIVAGNRIRQLTNANGLLKMENACLHGRVDELVKLCEEKDAVFIRMMSDGLRHKSPEAARQMVYRKQYLQAV